MKTLEELGISPAPWKVATNDLGEFVGVTNKHGFYAVRFAYDIPPNDARLIAAAPELYEACRDLLEIVENVFEYVGVDARTIVKIERAKAALAKASE